MSDFLISLGNLYNGESLLSIIKKPYGKRSPEGRYFDFAWGSLAVLNERLAKNRNIHERNGEVFAWVGDLLMKFSDETIDDASKHILDLWKHRGNDDISLLHDELFKKFNGAFVILLAQKRGFSLVTDLLGYTPVYVGRNEQNQIVAYGTHPDLVACISNDSFDIDTVSIAEFLNYGNCTYPNTNYCNVKEIEPRRLHNISCENNKVKIKNYIYWEPPKEKRQNYNENELVEELREALLEAVRDRCVHGKVVLLLSGGLDSRLVIAAVPDSVDCTAITFSDEMNREARIASQVAKCYNREWHLLIRDSEFLANSVVDLVKLMGCEFEWVNAHSSGFADEIEKYGADYVLTGEPFDCYFKAYYAIDIARIRRMGGLMPPKYEKRAFDFAIDQTKYWENNPNFWKHNFVKDLVESMYHRKRSYYEENLDPDRSSMEWIMSDPFSHDLDAANWVADRRVLPIRQVGMDRRLLDIAFKYPIELKLADKMIFLKAAMKTYGPGARIPCANDGVRPGSGYLSRLSQRAVRKFADRTNTILEKLGKRTKVQHSWNDYQKYWQESIVLKELIRKYSENLDQFNGQIFKERGQDLLQHDNIGWRNGFRLLQLAVWSHIIEDNRQFVKKQCRV